jgi:hypothetical protein
MLAELLSGGVMREKVWFDRIWSPIGKQTGFVYVDAIGPDLEEALKLAVLSASSSRKLGIKDLAERSAELSAVLSRQLPVDVVGKIGEQAQKGTLSARNCLGQAKSAQILKAH